MLHNAFSPVASLLGLLALAASSPTAAQGCYGGEGSRTAGDDLYWFGLGSYTETMEGDVYLSDLSFHIGGPSMGQGINLWVWGSSAAPTYDDGFVRIENIRHVDDSSFEFIKYADHVHYRFSLKAWLGHAGHLWFKISVKGRLDGPCFIRGDTDTDGVFDVSDLVRTLSSLFIREAEVSCKDAADFNDDGRVDLNDMLSQLEYLFLSGPAPAAPASACGPDPTPEDGLTCESYPFCP